MQSYKRTRKQSWRGLAVAAAVIGLVAPLTAGAEQLQPGTVAAFQRYIQSKEARSSDQLAAGKNFLWVDAFPREKRNEAYANLKRGQILTQCTEECTGCNSVPGGLIHDWTGIVFIPGVSTSQALAALQDYDRDADYYKPQVLKSKLLGNSGGDFRVYLRLKQVHMVTVVLDTEYDIRYTRVDGTHATSRSYSTRIAEFENEGEPQERDLPVGDDHGFLWRLYSYWRFYQADGGVYVECNAISLTRDVPTGLGWMIRPFIENVPSESLRFTLEATRTALAGKFGDASGLSHKTEQSQ